jgi:hypothetical protein
MENLNGKDMLGDVGINRWMILKWIWGLRV